MKRDKQIFILLLSTVLFFISLNSYSQLKTGMNASKIIATGWVNAPVKFDNKFIVLEFWATWCAPCLAALPHMNALQKEFKQNNDLLFLSHTSESVAKIKTILPKFHFESTIVSDTTYKTTENFGVDLIPATYLIDNKGIIKWVGEPKLLTKDILNRFLAGKDISQQARLSVKNEPNIGIEIDTLWKTYLGIFHDSSILNRFLLTNSPTFRKHKTLSSYSSSAYKVAETDVQLSKLFAEFLNTAEQSIYLPESLIGKYVSYCFKSSNVSTLQSAKQVLMDSIINRLNLNLENKEGLQEVIMLSVVDSLKLYSHKVSDKDVNMQGGNSLSDDKTVFSVHNENLNMIVHGIRNIFNRNVQLLNTQKYPGNFDFVLNTSSYEAFVKSIEYYGFKVSKKMESSKRYDFTYKE